MNLLESGVREQGHEGDLVRTMWRQGFNLPRYLDRSAQGSSQATRHLKPLHSIKLIGTPPISTGMLVCTSPVTAFVESATSISVAQLTRDAGRVAKTTIASRFSFWPSPLSFQATYDTERTWKCLYAVPHYHLMRTADF